MRVDVQTARLYGPTSLAFPAGEEWLANWNGTHGANGYNPWGVISSAPRTTTLVAAVTPRSYQYFSVARLGGTDTYAYNDQDSIAPIERLQQSDMDPQLAAAVKASSLRLFVEVPPSLQNDYASRTGASVFGTTVDHGRTVAVFGPCVANSHAAVEANAIRASATTSNQGWAWESRPLFRKPQRNDSAFR